METSGERPRRRAASSIANFFNQSYKFGGVQHKMLTRSVSRFLVKSGLPMHTVDKPSFQEMLSTFDRRYLFQESHFVSTVLMYRNTLSVASPSDWSPDCDEHGSVTRPKFTYQLNTLLSQVCLAIQAVFQPHRDSQTL